METQEGAGQHDEEETFHIVGFIGLKIHIPDNKTKQRRKCQTTWDFAHRYCGKIWLIIGLVSIPFSLVPISLVIDKSKDVVGLTGLDVLTLLNFPMQKIG